MPRLADWEDGLSLCLGAICDRRQAIVIASDLMLSLGSRATADYTLPKVYRVHQSWTALFSGDPGHAAGILGGVSRILFPSNTTGVIPERSVDELRQAFTTAYHEEVQRTRHEILQPFNWGLDDFLRDGPAAFGPFGFERLRQELYFSCDFLVAGFGGDHRPRLFAVEHPGVTTLHDLHGYWAIGSGAESALTWLMFHEMNFEMPIAEAVYRMCEAKFFGESAHGVGRSRTFVSVQRDEFKPVLVKSAELRRIRTAWRTSARGRVPHRAKTEIMKFITGRTEPKDLWYR